MAQTYTVIDAAEAVRLYEALTDQEVHLFECWLGQSRDPNIESLLPIVPGRNWPHWTLAQTAGVVPVEVGQATDPIPDAAEVVGVVGREQGPASADVAEQQSEEVDRFMERVTKERKRPGVVLASSSVLRQVRGRGGRSYMHPGSFRSAHNRPYLVSTSLGAPGRRPLYARPT